MDPPVDRANHAKRVKHETSEMWNKFKAPDRIIAAAWQQIIGINRRSKRSQGRSKLVDAGTNDVRRNELRRIEPRLSVSNEARRISLFYTHVGNKGIITNYFGWLHEPEWNKAEENNPNECQYIHTHTHTTMMSVLQLKVECAHTQRQKKHVWNG